MRAATAAFIRNRSAFARNLADAHELSEVGNKACNLAEMIELGVNVPPGIVLTNTAFLRFLDANGIDPSGATQTLVRTASIPREILEDILDFRSSQLPSGSLIVRSSAIGEDGVSASFAGLLDSICDVRTPAEIEHALLACWASYWNERVLFYQKARNVRLRGMGVIIQVQVASSVSGVLFTQAPENAAAKNELYLEYCSGAGEALVSGRVDPGRIRLSKTNCSYVVDRYAEVRSDCDERLLLNPEQAIRLVRASAMLEKHFDGPQDIEWTIDGRGELFFVQSRPITVTPSAVREILWSNANVNENFPAPITPFLYSIASEGYYHYFRNLALAFGLKPTRVGAMEHALRHIVGVHHSRIYYNLTSIHSVIRLAPFGETLAEFFNDFVGAKRMARRSPADESARWQQCVELFWALLRTTWLYLFLTRRVEQFEGTVDRFASATSPEDLDQRSLLSLRDDLRRFMDIRRHHWTNASLADAASMVCYGLLKLLLRSAYPAVSESACHNNLLAGLGVISAQPAAGLWDLSRKILAQPELAHWFSTTNSSQILDAVERRPELLWLRTDFHDYLDRWGFRFSGELMLTVPSFQEDPIPLVDLLKTYLAATGQGPIDSIRRRESERISETSRILEDLRQTKRLSRMPRFLQAPIVKLVLDFTHRAIALRERARAKQALLYSRCRRIALAIGRQLVQRGTIEKAGDIFFLTCSEVDELLSGHAMFPDHVNAQIAVRMQAHACACELSAPAMFTLAEGEYLSLTNRDASAEGDNDDPEARGSTMQGIGACGGKVVARAAVLESMSDGHMLQQGDILVTRQTDPGWAPIFFLIRGLVIERGGMLSHGAIIAREFGLPCVVGVDRAVSRIPHGAVLSVDGDQGNVRIVE